MKSQALVLAVSRVTSAAISFFGVAFVARTHPIEVVGEINALVALSQVASLAFGLGLSTSIIYFARYDFNESRRLLVAASVPTLALTLLCAGLSAAVSLQYGFVLLVSGVIALLANLAGLLQANQQFARQALLSVLQSAALPFANFVTLEVSAEVTTFFAAYAAADLILLCVGAVCLVKWDSFSFRSGYWPDKQVFTYGAKALEHNGANALWYSADILLMKYAIGGEYLGIYSVGATIAKSSWLVVDSVGLIIFPRKISGMLSRGDYFRVQVACAIYGLTAAVLWALVGNGFLSIIFGSRYEGAFPIVLVLMLGSLAVGNYKLESRLFAAEGRWLVLSLAQASGLAVSVASMLILGLALGGTGIAIGQGLGFLVCCLVLYGAAIATGPDRWSR